MPTNKLKFQRNLALIISASLFLISLTQETFYINRVAQPDAWANGFANLLLGLFSGNPSWFANLLIIPAWILTQRHSALPILFSFLAFITAFSFFFNGKVMGNEAGHIEYATKYLIGYWLWLLSMTSYFVYHVVILILEKKNKTTNSYS